MLNELVLLLLLHYVNCVLVNDNYVPNHLKDGLQSEKILGWTCVDDWCEKTDPDLIYEKNGMMSLETCKKICSENPIWPEPKFVRFFNKSYSQISDLRWYIRAPTRTSKFVHKFMKIFERYIKLDNTTKSGRNVEVRIFITGKNEDIKIDLKTDESYDMKVYLEEKIVVVITAFSYFGARHGLETLSQLIWFDPFANGYQILHGIEIEDFPSFPYRGVMVDTSRNFFRAGALKRVMDGMSFSKLNYLHLHLTDSVSFPIVLKDLEWLSEGGAYGPEYTYNEETLKELVDYGLVRGIKVLLEIDAPSHVSAGWHSNSSLPNLVICDDTDVLNGHLNPDNEDSLNVLEDLYRKLLKIMGNDDMIHIGGDEVNLTCWKNTKAAKNFTDLYDFWAQYTNHLIERTKRANGNKLPDNIIIWSSPLTDNSRALSLLNNTDQIVVQFWYGDPMPPLNQNMRLIFSTVSHWYLDCGFGPWKPHRTAGSCDPYKTWQNVYDFKPWNTNSIENFTIGGEVCLWSEEVAEESLQTRIWPRSAAFAERMWSDPERFEEESVYFRLDNFRDLLRMRGVKSSAIWPKWCSLNPGRC